MKITSANNCILKLIIGLSLFLPFSSVLSATPSVSIQSISPGTVVNYGNAVHFTAVPTDFNGSVNYSVSDSLGSSISNSNINSGGVFVWIPSPGEAGVHNITVNVSDYSGNTASATVQITVMGIPTVNIQNLYPGPSVNVNQTIFFNTSVSGFINPQYTIGDSFVSSTVSTNDINSSGNFSWTPRIQDVGSHPITVYVIDSGGRSANAVQNINVAVATAAIQSLLPGNTVVKKQKVTFTVSATGFTNPTYSVNDSAFGSTINNSNINSSGIFNWTPTQNDLGEHAITVRVSDSSGNAATVSQTITVTDVALSIGQISPGKIITVGSPLTFAAATTGFTSPSFFISDSFSGTSVTSFNMATTGVFTWTPIGKDVGSHYMNVSAIDSSGNSATANIIIEVNSATIPVTTNTQINAQINQTSNSKYFFNKFLSQGSNDADVTELQKLLIQQGFLSTQPTGYFGPLTTNAVKALQAANNLPSVGYVGPGTRAILNGVSVTQIPTSTNSVPKYTFSIPLKIDSSGVEVTELQKRLLGLGIYSGPITGYFGPLTEIAVKKFQLTHGLEQVGNVGPATRNLLNNSL